MSRRWIGYLVLLMGSAGVIWAQDSDRRPVPRLVCDAPEYSFGAVTNTGEIIHEFVIRNAGDAPLKIFRVKLACGCMLLRLMDDVLSPGKQTLLRVRFPLKGLSGPQRKRIRLVTNDPARPHVTLIMTGEAIAELEVRPRQLFWGNLLEAEVVEKTVTVRFHDDENFHVEAVESSSSLFAAECDPWAERPPARITVRTVPPLLRGRFQGSLKLQTDHPRFPLLTVPMSGRVVGALYTIPEEIVLVPTNRPVTRSLMVYASRKQKFKILRVDPPVTGIEARVRSRLFSGCRIELRNLVPELGLDGRCVVITTDYAPMKELSVPLRVREPEEAP